VGVEWAMTYLLAYEIDVVGIRKDKAMVINFSGNPHIIKTDITVHDNPYGDIYFIVRRKFEFGFDQFKSSIPAFVTFYTDDLLLPHNVYYLYGFRLVYAFYAFTSGYNYIFTEEDYVRIAKERASQIYSRPKDYIIVHNGTIAFIMLCDSVPEEELLKIIEENEQYVLWEATK